MPFSCAQRFLKIVGTILRSQASNYIERVVVFLSLEGLLVKYPGRRLTAFVPKPDYGHKGYWREYLKLQQEFYKKLMGANYTPPTENR